MRTELDFLLCKELLSILEDGVSDSRFVCVLYMHKYYEIESYVSDAFSKAIEPNLFKKVVWKTLSMRETILLVI